MDIKTILNLLAEHKLTADELLLVYLTYIARDEEGGHIEYFNQWFENGGNKQLRSLFESLKEKGIIHKDYITDSWDPNQIEFNKYFLKSWLKHSLQMGQELLDTYPSFLYINGKYAPLKDVSKRFSSLDEFFFFYSTQIGHNPKNHEKVMEILNWAKENGFITFGILSFVISNQWKALQELRDNPELIPVARSVDINEIG